MSKCETTLAMLESSTHVIATGLRRRMPSCLCQKDMKMTQSKERRMKTDEKNIAHICTQRTGIQTTFRRRPALPHRKSCESAAPEHATICQDMPGTARALPKPQHCIPKHQKAHHWDRDLLRPHPAPGL